MSKPTGVYVIDNVDSLISRQKAAIERFADPSRPIEILEAGCGRSWPFKLDGIKYRLTGIDLDAEALKHRMEVLRDLDEPVIGDLRTVVIDSNRFDVVYCAFVLEHIVDAQEVLRRFIRWLKPGGSIIINIPDPQSAHGFITKITPHWFHVLFYRYIVGYKEAGQPGHGPYKTFYDEVVSRPGMREFCRANGLAIELEAGVADMARYGHWRWRAVRLARRMISTASLGALSSQHSNLLFVLTKPRGDQV